jgi:hypothetical protein
VKVKRGRAPNTILSLYLTVVGLSLTVAIVATLICLPLDCAWTQSLPNQETLPDPRNIYPHDYVNQALPRDTLIPAPTQAPADPRPNSAENGAPTVSQGKSGFEDGAAWSVESPKKEADKTASGDTSLEHKVDQNSPDVAVVIVYGNSSDREHFNRLVNALRKAKAAGRARVSIVFHVGDYRNITSTQKASLQQDGIFLEALPAVPQDFNGLSSPVWEVHASNRKFLFSGTFSADVASLNFSTPFAFPAFTAASTTGDQAHTEVAAQIASPTPIIVRGEEGIPFPSLTEVVLEPSPTVSGVTPTATPAQTPTPWQKPGRCEKNETRVEELSGSVEANELLYDLLFVHEDLMPLDPDEVYGASVSLYPYGPKTGRTGDIWQELHRVPCVPYRIRYLGRSFRFDTGYNALKNYSSGQTGRGVFHPWVSEKLFGSPKRVRQR